MAGDPTDRRRGDGSVRPPAAHVMRAYLARTETFVHNQMAHLERYRPLPVAWYRRPNRDFPAPELAIGRELVPSAVAAADALAYPVYRHPLPPVVSALARWVREREVPLLHYHYLTDARQLVGVQRRTGLPAVVSGYGYDVSSIPGSGHGLGARWLRSSYDAFALFTAMSDDMAEDMAGIGVPADRIRVHYHGIDTERFRTPGRSYEPDGRLRVLCCGRLFAGKGQHQVLEALHRLGADVDVTFVGEGSLLEQLERMTAEYGWEDRVTFAGHVPHGSDELLGHFRGADVFAHPSATVDGVKEGIPGTIVEAMAAGLPVVATVHAGIPAVIDHDVHGLLVPEDDVGALAGALEAVLGDGALRRRLGEAAAARAAGELDIRTRTRALEAIYDELVT